MEEGEGEATAGPCVTAWAEALETSPARLKELVDKVAKELPGTRIGEHLVGPLWMSGIDTLIFLCHDHYDKRYALQLSRDTSLPNGAVELRCTVLDLAEGAPALVVPAPVAPALVVAAVPAPNEVTNRLENLTTDQLRELVKQMKALDKTAKLSTNSRQDALVKSIKSVWKSASVTMSGEFENALTSLEARKKTQRKPRNSTPTPKRPRLDDDYSWLQNDHQLPAAVEACSPLRTLVVNALTNNETAMITDAYERAMSPTVVEHADAVQP
jgi:hypothetical protein